MIYYDLFFKVSIFNCFYFRFVKKKFFVNIKMSYCWFNREELLQKAKRKKYGSGGQEKAAEYYQVNKDVIK